MRCQSDDWESEMMLGDGQELFHLKWQISCFFVVIVVAVAVDDAVEECENTHSWKGR